MITKQVVYSNTTMKTKQVVYLDTIMKKILNLKVPTSTVNENERSGTRWCP